jgi:hypothetical protein
MKKYGAKLITENWAGFLFKEAARLTSAAKQAFKYLACGIISLMFTQLEPFSRIDSLR